MSLLASFFRNPWGRPRWLAVVTTIYIVWSIIPVSIAILFAFNASRSRSNFTGLSLRWFNGATGSAFHDDALRHALLHSLELAALSVVVATPLGLFLALGLQRWRGRGAGLTNLLMLLPLVTPEIVMGVALLLLFISVFGFIGLGTTAQEIGRAHV